MKEKLFQLSTLYVSHDTVGIGNRKVSTMFCLCMLRSSIWSLPSFHSREAFSCFSLIPDTMVSITSFMGLHIYFYSPFFVVVLHFQWNVFYIWANIYQSFGDWLISLSIMFSNCIHLFADNRISFFKNSWVVFHSVDVL